MGQFTPQDAEFLLGREEFRRFLFSAIQSAGVLSKNPFADGRETRDLSIAEGRRSLGLDLLLLADAGQPQPLRSAEALATLDAVIRESLNPNPKDNARGKSDRYASITE